MHEARKALAEHFSSYLIDKVTGKSADRVVGDVSPEGRFFAGRIGPVQDDRGALFTSSTPTQIGMEFVLTKDEGVHAELDVLVSGDFYRRVNPKYEEQKQYYLAEFNKSFSDAGVVDINDVEHYLKSNPDKTFNCPVVPVYEKVSLVEYPFALKISDVLKKGKMNGRKTLDDQVHKALDKVLADAENLDSLYGTVNDPVSPSDLKNRQAWENFLSRCSGAVKRLNWDFTIMCEIKEYKQDNLRVGIYLINTAVEGKDKKDRINTIFNTKLHVKVNNADVQPIELNYFYDDYKYDRTEPAVGKNCSIRDRGRNEIETVSAPVYKQYRLKTFADKADPKFKVLSEDPFPLLEQIKAKMEEELSEWQEDFNNRQGLTAKARRKFNDEISDFEREIDRFSIGIDVLKDYPDVLRAFKLMNKAFMRSAKGYESWHLFQIVFIVSVIPDIACREHEEIQTIEEADSVDLIYFPTGGGKTETYLGTIVFAMFFDRIRGKKAGITSIIKFPLRLLSLQQLQRAADITAAAETIRRENEDLAGSDGFSVGYFVGSGNTPNKLIDEDDRENWDLAKKLSEMDEKERTEKYLIIDRCPFCGQQSVVIDVLLEERRLVHRCRNEDCSENVLPVYIVDREIYRYLPTLLVSTLDKSALMGLQRNFRNLLGFVSKKCPVHGFSSLPGCTETEKDVCSTDPSRFASVSIYDPAPTLIVQDELHLVRESLGAFNAHYESFMNYFLKHFSSSGKPIKVIAATATITDYEQQIYHLYHNKAPRRFPTPSPYLDKSFYSYIDKDDLNRIIIGIAPQGKTSIYSIQDLIEYYRKEVYRLWTNPAELRKIPGLENIDVNDGKEILKDYWVILEYNQIKNESMQVIQSVQTMINDNLRAAGTPAIKPKSMTGDDTFKDIREILAELENPADELPEIDLIAATSMISHGVDADRFNFMIFFGVPKNTAEYIQAYSRAGRKHPAVIFMILNSNREKDSSYSRNFVKFNAYKDILVEPVPINRWANKAVNKTLPGLFSALLLNYYDFKIHEEHGIKTYMLTGFQQAVKEKLLPSAEEIAEKLCGAYGADSDNLGEIYRQEIYKLVKQIYDRLMSTECSPRNDYYLTKALEKAGFPVMRSLRDTDIPVILEMGEPDAEMIRKVSF